VKKEREEAKENKELLDAARAECKLLREKNQLLVGGEQGAAIKKAEEAATRRAQETFDAERKQLVDCRAREIRQLETDKTSAIAAEQKKFMDFKDSRNATDRKNEAVSRSAFCVGGYFTD
jgi:hypothetical protein